MEQVNKFLAQESSQVPNITADEFERAINSLKKGAAPGTDGITSELLQMCSDVCKEPLSHILNSCLKNGYFPAKWKEVKLSVLKKPGKPSYEDVKSYRPISVQNAMGKL